MISSGFWNRRRVALIGDARLEDAWLAAMLDRLNARVTNLRPEAAPSGHEPSGMAATLVAAGPEIVIATRSDVGTLMDAGGASIRVLVVADLRTSGAPKLGVRVEARVQPDGAALVRVVAAGLLGHGGPSDTGEAGAAGQPSCEADLEILEPACHVMEPLRLGLLLAETAQAGLAGARLAAPNWRPLLTAAESAAWMTEWSLADPQDTDRVMREHVDRYLGLCVRLTPLVPKKPISAAAPVGLAAPPGGADAVALRSQILDLVGQYHDLAHRPAPFDPARPSVQVSGRVYDATDMRMLVDSALDFWLTTGRFNAAFETRLAARVGARHALTVNSGSSANLVALSALTSPKLKDRRLRAGDEVITCATGFPTTVNPVLHWNMVPVFVDVAFPTYNIDVAAVAAAVTPRTRAIMVAHTLGNPFDVAAIRSICDRHGLFLIEDCCDALGATVGGRHVGTFGDVGTLSFYPAHHITMGEGGAVFTNDSRLNKIMESFRDWGRDCYCDPGCDNTCNKRYGWQLGDLPKGYDHKYVYSHLGFNLKITDMQAAVGLAQMDHLESFIARRRSNFDLLRDGLRGLEDIFILPEATPGTEPSWFGLPLTLRDDAPFRRDDLVIHLNSRGIGTRLLFGGNLVRQPYMKGRDFRISGSLANADRVVERTFWIGVYPGIGADAIGHVLETIEVFCRGSRRAALRA